MAASEIQTALSGTTCEVQVLPPTDTKDLENILPRWSSVTVSTPHAIVTPSTISDIVAVVAYATAHSLKVIPTGGNNNAALPINSKTIYLSLSQFKKMDLDESSGVVEFGGGVISGDLMNYLGEKGYCTAVPNSNKIGMVGALMGGLIHPLVGVHGRGCDNIEEVRIVPYSTADGSELRELVLRKDATDEMERRLLNVVSGAGMGFGIVTSVKLKA